MGTFLELLVVWPVLANSGQMIASLLMGVHRTGRGRGNGWALTTFSLIGLRWHDNRGVSGRGRDSGG